MAVHLRAHAQLARDMGMDDDHIFVVDNGDTLEMTNGIVKFGEPVENGIVYVDGLSVGDTEVMKPSDVPGYGRADKESYWGFNYQVFIRLPVRKTPSLPTLKK